MIISSIQKKVKKKKLLRKILTLEQKFPNTLNKYTSYNPQILFCEAERQRVPIYCFIPQMSTTVGAAATAEGRNPTQSSHMSGRDPISWATEVGGGRWYWLWGGAS